MMQVELLLDVQKGFKLAGFPELPPPTFALSTSPIQHFSSSHASHKSVKFFLNGKNAPQMTGRRGMLVARALNGSEALKSR